MIVTLPASAGFWLFIAASPIAAFVMWDDLAHFKIRNISSALTLLIFIAVGFWVLPGTVLLWQFAMAGVAFLAGLILFSAGLIPGGDAKYLAAISPYFVWPDWRTITALFVATVAATLVLRWLARRTNAARLTPDWSFWDNSRRIPLGVPLAMCLMLYLGLSTMTGATG